MEWINIHVPTLRSPEYIGSEPIARAAWWNVLAYCVEQENGGRIVGAANWKDRQWQQTCGVTRDEVLAAMPLLVIEDQDVIVWRYPVNTEDKVRAKREAGSAGGKAKGKRNPSKPEAKPKHPASEPPTKGEGEGNEKKGEEKREGEENAAAAACPAGPSLSQWMQRVKNICPDQWTADWWEKKWGAKGSVGWENRVGQPITNWQVYQDSMTVYFRNDLAKHKAKSAESKPATEAEVEALAARNKAAAKAQMEADQAELQAALARGRE
jgi:hypothetical protein